MHLIMYEIIKIPPSVIQSLVLILQNLIRGLRVIQVQAQSIHKVPDVFFRLDIRQPGPQHDHDQPKQVKRVLPYNIEPSNNQIIKIGLILLANRGQNFSGEDDLRPLAIPAKFLLEIPQNVSKVNMEEVPILTDLFLTSTMNFCKKKKY